MDDWFKADKDGLAKLMERRGKSYAIFELISDAFDTSAEHVKVSFYPVAGQPKATIEVEDDHPEGFKDLAHSFTLFAESERKADATKRGRFNLGLKLVLALCDEAKISSTTGTVMFDKVGRHRSAAKRIKGSVFTATMRMTRAEYDEAMKELLGVLPPMGINLVFNGAEVPHRTPLHTILDVKLPTEISDGEGILRRTERKTVVQVVEVQADEEAMIYELGIPVVATGDRWHINVGQKVPLNMDRDNVTPAYLRQLRTIVVNAMQDKLTTEEANSPLVREAAASPDVTPEAMARILDLRFGAKRVSFDPSDPEANKRAVAAGYTVVAGSMMGKQEWANARAAGAILPAGQVTPTPKPYGPGDNLGIIPREEYSVGMHAVVNYCVWLGEKLLKAKVEVNIAKEAKWPYLATYGKSGSNGGHLVFNMGKLGRRFFEEGLTTRMNELIIHEFGHHYSLDHLDGQFHDALCDLGARLTAIALDDPHGMHSWFKYLVE